MPLWLVIMVLGLAGCGFLFLKARETEKGQTLKKVKQGHKSVRKAARAVAKRPSTQPVYMAPTSTEEVGMSQSLADAVVRDLEEILERNQ